MLFNNNNQIWLGTQTSHENYMTMQRQFADGTLLKMAAENPELKALSGATFDEDGERIGDPLIQIAEGVAIISIKGGLVPSYAWYNSWFGIVSYEEIRDALQIAVEDDNVKKILLDVDSPGGAVSFLDEAADFIAAIDKNIKPVYGHTTSHAFSAGYWLISSARKITASKMAQLGSIGVLLTTVSYAKALEEAGVKYTYIRSGEHKALGQFGEELTEEAKAELQESVNNVSQFFFNQVKSRRPALASANFEKWNTGKTFLAKEAMDIGLVDEITTFDLTVAKLFENSNNGYNLSNNTSLSEEAIMKLKNLLSKDQLAKLAAGVALSNLGLSAEDLEKAQAIQAGESDSEEEETEVTEEESEVTSEEEETEDDEESEDDSEDSTEASNVTQLMSANTDLAKQLARVEVKLEQEQESTTALEEQIETLKATQATLVTIAAEATNKLQVAVGAQASSFEGSSAEDVITHHTSAKEKFETTFGTGAKSKASVTSRSSQESLQPKHPIKKVK